MSNPITSPTIYYELEKLKLASEALAKENGLRGNDPFVQDTNGQPLEFGAASTNAIAHALSSAYLAYDHSPAEASILGWAREHKSYWFEPERPAAWDTFKDLYNNQVGRNIANYIRNNNLSREQIQDLILDALSSGKLIVTQQDKRIDPSFNGDPRNFSLPIGDAAPWTAPSAGFSDFAPSVTRVPVALPKGSNDRTLLPTGTRVGNRDAEPAVSLSESGSYSLNDITPRNANVAVSSPPVTEGMIGLFSGKPMQFPFAPIFERRASSGATGGPSRPSALDDLISSFGKSQTSPFDAGAAAPVVSDRQAFTDSGNGAPTLTASPASFVTPTPAPPDPQGPLSLNEAYLEYLKRLNASQPQTLDTNASSPPLTPSDDANFSGGLVGRLTALLGAGPENPDLSAVSPRNDPSDAADDDFTRFWPFQRWR